MVHLENRLPYWFKTIKREFDDLPIAAQLYITDQCNLDCHYCSEYDNSGPHPSLADIKIWVRKIKDLGCIRIGLQGGEPLVHPDIVAIIRYCKSLKLRTSMSTNGFKLTRTLIRDFEDAGLDSLQISVDKMNPVASTRKSLKTVIPKIDLLMDSKLKFNVTGVLFKDTIDEAQEVLEYGYSKDIAVHSRLVHSGPPGSYHVETGKKDDLEGLIDFQIKQKRRGHKVHTTEHLFDYQKSLLNGHDINWTCIAGYKYFFVSAKGKFWLCSLNRQPNIDFMEVTPELLNSYSHKKECQDGCGVYCVVSESMAYKQPLKFAAREARALLTSRVARSINGVEH